MRELLINEIKFVSGGDLNHFEDPSESPYKKHLRETGQRFGADESTLDKILDFILDIWRSDSEETKQIKAELKTIEKLMEICMKNGGNFNASSESAEIGVKRIGGIEGGKTQTSCTQPGR